MGKPVGFVQVDVDGLWAVRACYGKPERDSYDNDPCWIEGVPALAELFLRSSVPASFFIVGRDLALDSKQKATKKLISQSFEIGNHSYSHQIGLTLRPTGMILDEIGRTDQMLRSIGANPVGFRSPGYDIDARILRVVRRFGYLYDASMLPTYLAPLLRIADSWLSRRWYGGKRQFGRFAYGRAPRQPYFPRPYAIRKASPNPGPGDLLEIPVGTTPRLHLPLTASTLFGMRRSQLHRLFSKLADKGRPTMLLLHAIDGTDCRRPIVFGDRRSRLAGFSMAQEKKLQALSRIVEEFSKSFAIETAAEYAKRIPQAPTELIR